MSNNTWNNKSYRKKVIFIVPRDPKTGKRKKIGKHPKPEKFWAGKIKDGKWVPRSTKNYPKPKPFIYPRDPSWRKGKEFTPKAKKMKGGKY